MIKFQIDKLRSKADRLLREYQAIYCLINGMTIQIRQDFKRDRGAIANRDKKELQKAITVCNHEIRELRKMYGVKAPNSDIIELAEMAESAPHGQFLLIPKYFLDDIFSDYGRILSDYSKYPCHMRIGIDSGMIREEEGPIELYLLEAILFEDMCALFNIAKKSHTEYKTEKGTKTPMKTYSALLRATTTTAFYFIEAYLNGIAFDYYYSNQDKLDNKTKSILTEWDYTRDRQKFLSFKDKALKYFKIILGTKHPPLQESNCPELEFILSKGKELRDSIVHASPKFSISDFDPKKEKALFGQTFEDTEAIVDNAIELVKKIEIIISNNYDRLWWIHSRGSDGFFPEEVFE
jgi:hypothetical protein